MTPQERRLIDELFERLAGLEKAPRDAEAERAIAAGLTRAPNALYPLVQTVLVQDEALKRAEAQICELTGNADNAANGGFLDTMRQAFNGGRATSVPSVRGTSDQSDPRWNTGGAAFSPQAQGQQQAQQQGQAQGQPQAQPQQPSQGGSFLGTAAATAAGVIGGSMLFNALGGMFGHNNSGSAFANTRPDASPWGNSGNDAISGNLARDAGLNDVGTERHAGLFDSNDDSDNGGDYDSDMSRDFGGDFGGDSI